MCEVTKRIIPGEYPELQRFQVAINDITNVVQEIVREHTGLDGDELRELLDKKDKSIKSADYVEVAPLRYNQEFLSQFSHITELLQMLLDDELKSLTE